MNRENKETLLFVFACACGAFVGTVVAVSHHFAWKTGLSLGMLVGALVGRSCYHPILLGRDLLAALDSSIKKVIHADFAAWRRDNDIRSWACWLILCATWLLPWCLAVVFHPDYVRNLLQTLNKQNPREEALWFILLAISSFAGTMIALYSCPPNDGNRSFEKQLRFLVRRNLVCGPFLLLLNNLALCALLLAWLIAILHAKEGSLVMFAAVLGVLAGWFWNSPIIGAVAGGLIGFIEYRFVGERIGALKSAIDDAVTRFEPI